MRGWLSITPLIRAVQSGHLPLIKYLIANGADPNSTEYEFGTPLFIAARKENIDVFKYLLGHGAQMKTRDELNDVFFEAAQNSHLDIVKYLVEERGADVNTARYFGIFALDTFRLYHDTERFFAVIDYALNHGLDLNRPAAGSIVLFLVKEYAEKPARTLALLKRCVARGASVGALDESGQSPLFSAVEQSRVMRHRQFETLGHFLLAHGANPSATDLSGQSILAHAESIRCSDEVINWLKKNGAQYSPSDIFSKAAEAIFEDARWHKKSDVESIARLAKLIGQFKNHYHLTNKDGETLLHMASQSGRIALVKYLLENGFSATAVDSAHHTPLYYALTTAYSIEMAQLLLANGAALPKNTDEAYSWIFRVLSNGRFDVLSFLQSEGVVLTAPDDAQHIDSVQRRLQPIFGVLTQMITFQPSHSGALDCALYILNFYLDNDWDPLGLVDPQNQSIWKAIVTDSVARCDTDMLNKLIDTFSRFGSFKRLCDAQTWQLAKQCSDKPFHEMLNRGSCYQ